MEGPVEPVRERFDVTRLHRRPAPDAQARRRVAVIGDVEGDASFSRMPARFFANAAWSSPDKLATAGSTTFRHTEVFERSFAFLARWPTQGVTATQSAIALALASERAMVPLRRRPTSPRPACRDSPRRTASTAC